MKFLIAIISFFCLLQSTKAQLQDTSKLVFKTKILLLEYAEVFDQEGIDYFFKEMPLEFQPLRSKGFSKNMMFFRIPIEYDKTSLVSFAFNYDFIIGYNNLNGSIYRLKGFKKNDFYIIFSQFSYSFNVDDTVNIRKNLSAKKKFLNTYGIESLDMACLFKSLKKEEIPNPCLRRVRKVYETNEPW